METPFNIVDHIRTRYYKQWFEIPQQTACELEPFCSTLPGGGEKVRIPYLGTTELTELGTERFAKANPHELGTAMREILPRRFGDSLHLDEFANTMLEDVEVKVTHFIQQQKYALKRALTQALLGVVPDGSGGYRQITAADTTSSTKKITGGGLLGANYAGTGFSAIEIGNQNVIPFDYMSNGAKNTSGFLVDQIEGGKRILTEKNVWSLDSGKVLCMVISPRMHEQMCMWESSKNQNYGFQSLKGDPLTKVCGVQMIVSNMLPKDADGNRICPMWVKDALIYAPWDNTRLTVVRPDEYQNQTVVRVDISTMFGTARRSEDEVVLIKCKEA